MIVPKPEELSEENLVWILDQLLIREVAWIDGWPISYTCYDMVYFHDSKLAEKNPQLARIVDVTNQVLEKAYSLAIHAKAIYNVKYDDLMLFNLNFMKPSGWLFFNPRKNQRLHQDLSRELERSLSKIDQNKE